MTGSSGEAFDGDRLHHGRARPACWAASGQLDGVVNGELVDGVCWPEAPQQRRADLPPCRGAHAQRLVGVARPTHGKQRNAGPRRGRDLWHCSLRRRRPGGRAAPCQRQGGQHRCCDCRFTSSISSQTHCDSCFRGITSPQPHETQTARLWLRRPVRPVLGRRERSLTAPMRASVQVVNFASIGGSRHDRTRCPYGDATVQ